MLNLYVLRHTGSGAYIDGPFTRPSNARRRADNYRRYGWGPETHIIPAGSRDEALNLLAKKLGLV